MRTKRLTGSGRLVDADEGGVSLLVRYSMNCTEYGGMMEATGKVRADKDSLAKLKDRRLYLTLEDQHRILVKFSDGAGNFQSPGVFDE